MADTLYLVLFLAIVAVVASYATTPRSTGARIEEGELLVPMAWVPVPEGRSGGVVGTARCVAASIIAGFLAGMLIIDAPGVWKLSALPWFWGMAAAIKAAVASWTRGLATPIQSAWFYPLLRPDLEDEWARRVALHHLAAAAGRMARVLEQALQSEMKQESAGVSVRAVVVRDGPRIEAAYSLARFSLDLHQKWLRIVEHAAPILRIPLEQEIAGAPPIRVVSSVGELRVLLAVAYRPEISAQEQPEEATVEVVEELPAPQPVDLSPLGNGLPPLDILADVSRPRGRPAAEGQRAREAVASALKSLGFTVEEMKVYEGPTVVTVIVRPGQGARAGQILRAANDLAVEMGSGSGVRVLQSPEPGTVAIEVPRAKRATVGLRDVLGSPSFREADGALPVGFGLDTFGRPIVHDLARAPHLLVAGTTGSGKSVALHALILSLLVRHSPDDLRLVLIDPKHVEFSRYEHIPHLWRPVITEVPEAVDALAELAEEMDQRYRTMSVGGTLREPYIVVVADEVADIMLAGSKEQREQTQKLLARLLAKARAARIHVVLATQRPTAEVIPGLIKANAPARLALSCSSELESRIILDDVGAESLIGQGDALLLWPGVRSLIRLQAPLVREEDIAAVTGWWRVNGGLYEAVLDRIGVQLEHLEAQGLAARRPDGIAVRKEVLREAIAACGHLEPDPIPIWAERGFLDDNKPVRTPNGVVKMVLLSIPSPHARVRRTGLTREA